jgi:hypothetical protein
MKSNVLPVALGSRAYLRERAIGGAHSQPNISIPIASSFMCMDPDGLIKASMDLTKEV